jgi:hypothetical protein
MKRHFPFMAVASLAGGLFLHSLPAQSEQLAGHPRIGVCVHFSNGWYTEPEIPKMIAEAGFTWAREDFYWSSIEKEKGIYVMPDSYRKTIDDLNAAGLKVLAIFNGSNKLYAPDIYDAEAYARAAAWFARETRGKVQAIEILNEPHNFGFSKHYGGTWNGVEKDGSVSKWVPKYVQLLNTAAPAIKAANPEVKVLGLGGVPPVTFRQLEMGISPVVDAITDHPYSPRMTAEYVPYASKDGILQRDGVATADERGTFVSQEKMMREQSAKFHGPKAIWHTEFGWPSYQETKNGNLFAGLTRDAQAKYLLRRMAEALGVGTDMLFVYNFRDNGTDEHNAEHNFGLLDIKLKPKPSYDAVSRFNHYMAPFQTDPAAGVSVFPVTTHADYSPVVWDGSRIEAGGKVLAYPFIAGDGRKTTLVWASERAGGDLQPAVADVEISTDKPAQAVKAYDFLTGETRDVSFVNKDGRVMLKKMTVTDSPVALIIES